MTEPAHYGPTSPAPLCRCGQPSEWIGAFGRSCGPCLPIGAQVWQAWGRLSREIASRFAEVAL